MHSLGIRTGTDLKQRSLAELIQHFGKAGHYYYKIARGQDDRAVEPNRIRKSIGAETSFAKDLSDRALMLLELEKIAQTVKLRLDQHQTGGRTLTLKVKFSDYQQITRSKTVLTSIQELNEIIIMAKLLFEGIELSDVSRQAAPRLRSIRLLGISLSNLDNENAGVFVQLSLFEAFR